MKKFAYLYAVAFLLLCTNETYSQNAKWNKIEKASSSSIVYITTDEKCPGAASGTGFVVSLDGHVITARHVLPKNCNFVLVKPDPGVSGGYVADVVSRSNSTDAALLRIRSSSFRPQPIFFTRNTGALKGVEVVALGFITNSNPKPQYGKITGSEAISPPDRQDEIIEVASTNVATGKGYSGGPMLDSDGCAVGLTIAGRTGPAGEPVDNFTYLVPWIKFGDLLGGIPTPSSPRHGFCQNQQPWQAYASGTTCDDVYAIKREIPRNPNDFRFRSRSRDLGDLSIRTTNMSVGYGIVICRFNIPKGIDKIKLKLSGGSANYKAGGRAGHYSGGGLGLIVKATETPVSDNLLRDEISQRADYTGGGKSINTYDNEGPFSIPLEPWEKTLVIAEGNQSRRYIAVAIKVNSSWSDRKGNIDYHLTGLRVRQVK